MNDQAIRRGRFAELVLPHLDSAYNLARWLTDAAGDADDVVHDAHMIAFRAFYGFRGGDARVWLLTIVRHASYRRLLDHCGQQDAAGYDDVDPRGPETGGPDALMLRTADARLVERALRTLPVPYREVLVLRELEGLTYADIAAVIGQPIADVMPRLSRARNRFRRLLGAELASGKARTPAGGDPREQADLRVG